jgi:hypothetical protein
VVVVDEGDGADRFRVAAAPLLLDERVADEVAHRLRAVHVALVGDERVESLDEPLVGRDPESDDVRHRMTPSCAVRATTMMPA